MDKLPVVMRLSLHLGRFGIEVVEVLQWKFLENSGGRKCQGLKPSSEYILIELSLRL